MGIIPRHARQKTRGERPKKNRFGRTPGSWVKVRPKNNAPASQKSKTAKIKLMNGKTNQKKRITPLQRQQIRRGRMVKVGLLGTVAAFVASLLLLRTPARVEPRPKLTMPSTVAERRQMELTPQQKGMLKQLGIPENVSIVVPTTGTIPPELEKNIIRGTSPRGTRIGEEFLENTRFNLSTPYMSIGNGLKSNDLYHALKTTDQPLGVRLQISSEDLGILTSSGEKVTGFELFGVHYGGNLYYQVGQSTFVCDLETLMRARPTYIERLYAQ